MLYPVSLVYLVTDMTSQAANLLNISNMKLELIKQNVDWYIANCFKFKTINICLQSFLSSRLSPSNPAVWEYSLCVLWSECDCPLGWGSRLYSFRAMPCLSDNYTIYCLSWSGCDVSAGCLWKTTQIFFNCTILWLCLPVWFLYTNVLRVFRFLYFPFRLKSHFLLAFSESSWVWVPGHRGTTQSAMDLLMHSCLWLPWEWPLGNSWSISPLFSGICLHIKHKMALLIQQLFKSPWCRLFEKLQRDELDKTQRGCLPVSHVLPWNW